MKMVGILTYFAGIGNALWGCQQQLNACHRLILPPNQGLADAPDLTFKILDVECVSFGSNEIVPFISNT